MFFLILLDNFSYNELIMSRMKSTQIMRNELSFYSQNELILASKLYKKKLQNIVNEATFYKIVEKFSKNTKHSD